MTDIDRDGSNLVAELELEVDENNLDIEHHARERDSKMGQPNMFDNILVPLWTILHEKPLPGCEN